MKKIFYLFLMCTLFIACGDDDDDLSEIKLSKTICVLDNKNSYAIVDITKGGGDYQVKSSNENVAVSTVDNNQILVLVRYECNLLHSPNFHL